MVSRLHASSDMQIRVARTTVNSHSIIVAAAAHASSRMRRCDVKRSDQSSYLSCPRLVRDESCCVIVSGVSIEFAPFLNADHSHSCRVG
jgi:hypothetical protein